ncbi:MAG TPA: Ig-like domain-containing protein [Myxococcaceae bacterium]
MPYTYDPVVTDPGGPGPITFSVDPADTCGGSANGSSGSYTFTPGPGAPATCVMAIQACDALGACTTQQTTITINHLPVAVNDNASATGPITIPGGTLTANDSPGGPPSEAGQTLTVTGVSATSSQGGTVTLVGGVVTYTPPAGFTGTDTFTYTVTDSGNPALTATATVTVIVTMNAPPGFISTGPTAAGEGVPFTYNPVVTDPDGPGPITYSPGLGDTCGGSVNGSSGSYTFTPGSGAPATCVMAVQACDAAGACSSQQTTVTINHQPVAMNDTANATGPITIPGGTLTANDSPGGPPSEAGQTLTITGVSVTSSQGGTVSLAGGVVTYTPPPGFVGTDTFTYTVTDSGNPALTATATVTVTVTAPANAPPVISSTPAATAPEGTPYVYDATATDPDGPGATWSVGAGDTCGGTIDPATGHYTFTPGAATPSPCTLAVQVCDGGSPNQCVTQATPVTITRPSGDAGFLDGLGASGSGCGCSSGAALASLPWYGIPALLALARRRRRKSGAGLRPG